MNLYKRIGSLVFVILLSCNIISIGAETLLSIPVRQTEVMDISCGNGFSVGLQKDGSVIAVGDNSYGQINVSGWRNIVKISSSDTYTAGIRSDGGVELTNNTQTPQVNLSGWQDLVDISVGTDYIVGIKSDGSAIAESITGLPNYTYGWNKMAKVLSNNGQIIGLDIFGGVSIVGGNIKDSTYAAQNWMGIVDIVAGDNHIVGLQKDGTIVAAGSNLYGQLNVEKWTNIKKIFASNNQTIGLKNDGTVVATGANQFGQLNISSWQNISNIAIGYNHTLGLKEDGTIISAGSNSSGQKNVSNWNLSMGTTVIFSHNNMIYKDKFNLSLSTTKSGYDIYYTNDGSDPLQNGLLYENPIEILENTTIKAVAKLLNYSSPVVEKKYRVNSLKVPTLTADTMAVSADGLRTVGLKRDGTVVAVGNNDYGQINISDWNNIVAISTDYYHTVGLKIDGTVVAVGENDYKKLDVSNWNDIVAISAGSNHTVGLKRDGTVIGVGNNKSGQLDVSSWNNIVAISAGSNHTFGLKADGTVVVVGEYYYGQLDVSNWNDIIEISVGENHVIGLKADGTVVGVGYNGYGQLNVTNWNDIVAISAGGNHTVGLKADGTVVGVGYNGYGQLNVTNWNDIVAISAGSNHTVGLKADGTVVGVGYNGYGQLNVTNWNLNTPPTIWDSSYKMIYENPANISLTTRAGYDIYYTKDGSIPTKFSQLYQNPIILDKTTTLKAIAYKDGVYGSIYEATYVINDTTIPTTSGTNISGSISQNTIWKRSNSPYKINGNTLISSGTSLYIEPGVEILFAKDVALQVQGSIYCLGIADNKINIKGQTTDKWAYIHINNQSENDKAYIDNTEISNAQKGIYAVKGKNIVVNNSVINNCAYGAVSSLFNFILKNTKLEHNVSGYSGGGNINNCVISNNSNNGIDNNDNYELTVTNSIIDNNNIGLYGMFTADNCIISNNYYGINSYYSNFSIRNSSIVSNKTGIYNNYYDCTIENCLIENNLYSAVHLGGRSYSTQIIKGCTIANNGGYGIDLDASNVFVNYNNIYNNTLGHVNANFGSTGANLNFKNNYWGTTNYNEIGAKIIDFFDYYDYPIVDFEPYLSNGTMSVFIEKLNDQNDILVSSTNLLSLTRLKISAFSKLNTKSNLYIAYYDVDNKLISTQINEVDFISSTNNYEIILNTPVPTNTKKVRLFMWDAKFKPISEGYFIN